MIERGGILIHLELPDNRKENRPFTFTGWVAADRAVTAVALPGTKRESLTLCERPDVKLVFPGRMTLGFSGHALPLDLGPGGLRLVLKVGDDRFEIEHPLPPPLPRRSLARRVAGALRLFALRVREMMSADGAARWRWVLRRHLLLREERGGIFERRHTEALLGDFADVVREATFLQIGANDGSTGDPLCSLLARKNTRWRGVLVEPIAHLCEQLVRRYEHNPALKIERAAICEVDGEVVMHRLQTEAWDSLWLDQLPSLELEVLERNAQTFGVGDKQSVSEVVPSLCVATLLKRYRVENLDLLVIDTEGWDGRILQQFDLTRCRPKLILYEHQHLGQDERAQVHGFLARHSYDWVETPEGDTLAWPA